MDKLSHLWDSWFLLWRPGMMMTKRQTKWADLGLLLSERVLWWNCEKCHGEVAGEAARRLELIPWGTTFYPKQSWSSLPSALPKELPCNNNAPLPPTIRFWCLPFTSLGFIFLWGWLRRNYVSQWFSDPLAVQSILQVQYNMKYQKSKNFSNQRGDEGPSYLARFYLLSQNQDHPSDNSLELWDSKEHDVKATDLIWSFVLFSFFFFNRWRNWQRVSPNLNLSLAQNPWAGDRVTLLTDLPCCHVVSGLSPQGSWWERGMIYGVLEDWTPCLEIK